MKFDGIVDWEREAPQWPALLAAARASGSAAGPADDVLWRVYGPLIKSNIDHGPFVIAQMGQSLDGRIATANGHSHYINGPAALVHLHRLRALVDAVVIGVGTALADDPQLSVRHVPGPHPARVVIDPRGRLPASARCLEPGARRIVIGDKAPPVDGVEHLAVTKGEHGIAPGDIVTALYRAGLKRILVEGGGRTVSRFLEAEALDRLHIMVAPKIIGAGPVGLSYGALTNVNDAHRPDVQTFALPGGDTLFDCAF